MMKADVELLLTMIIPRGTSDNDYGNVADGIVAASGSSNRGGMI